MTRPPAILKLLSALQEKPTIVAAFLYSANGGVVAAYHRDLENSNQSPPSPDRRGSWFEGGRLKLFRDIVVDHTAIGTIYLESDLQDVQSKLRRSEVMVLAILLIAFMLGFLVASRLQRAITRPIAILTETAQSISRKKTYGSRAEKGAV